MYDLILGRCHPFITSHRHRHHPPHAAYFTLLLDLGHFLDFFSTFSHVERICITNVGPISVNEEKMVSSIVPNDSEILLPQFSFAFFYLLCSPIRIKRCSRRHCRCCRTARPKLTSFACKSAKLCRPLSTMMTPRVSVPK